MSSRSQLESLSKALSPHSRVLVEQQSSDFQNYLQRWSDIGKRTPGAIVIPSSIEDCQRAVQWAVTTETAFVSKSGGMSLDSTIDQEGIIIDLSDLASIHHNRERQEATLIGGISSKAVALELAKDGFCTPLPSANPVGANPFFLNGGNSPLISNVGYASDNIIGAQMINANGQLVTVSGDENPDLLYALRGAGQYFGLVVSLTVRTYPVVDVLGNKDGTLWSALFVFPVERAEEVSEALEQIVNNSNFCTNGVLMIAAPPPAFKPAVVVSAKLIGPNSDLHQKEAFRPLNDLQPMVANGSLVRIENNGDALQAVCQCGDFKKLRLTGIFAYGPTHFPELVVLWQDLTSSCPDATGSMFSIQWSSSHAPKPGFESANSMHSTRFWGNNMIWCKDRSSVDTAQSYLKKAIAVTRQNQKEKDFVDFTNSVREPDSPIDQRYKGKESLEKLKALKRDWDPHGRFGKELL